MQPHVQFCFFIEEESKSSAEELLCKLWCRRGGPLYRVMMEAPPTLAMVPRIFAKPSLLLILTCSTLKSRKVVLECCSFATKQRHRNIVMTLSYPRADAMTKVIAGTEFCIAEAKVGDA